MASDVPPAEPRILDAATVILLRRDPAPSVLMGQRGAKAVFMPSKFVFPGGRVDRTDGPLPGPGLRPAVADALTRDSACAPERLAAAAIRELWEETAQILGTPGAWDAPPAGWEAFADTGNLPDASGLQFFFRAVTPKGRPRRFDARFFLVEATALASDPDDLTGGDGELSHLAWVPLTEARALDLPFVTEVALAELTAHLKDPDAPLTVPFFRNDDEAQLVSRLNGVRPLDL